MTIAQLRNSYHRNLCKKILFVKGGVPNIADGSSKASVAIALEIISLLNHPLADKAPPGQTAGFLFEHLTKDFLSDSFEMLHHIRPGKWLFSVNQSISQFEQYAHVAICTVCSRRSQNWHYAYLYPSPEFVVYDSPVFMDQ